LQIFQVRQLFLWHAISLLADAEMSLTLQIARSSPSLRGVAQSPIMFFLTVYFISFIVTPAKNIFRAIFVAASLILAMPAFAAELRVRIEGIAETGSIHVYVFSSADGFPKEERAVFHQVYPRPAPAQNELEIRISVPDAPEYAVMSFQDKNGDGKMNRLLGMIPQEPYGLSRNPRLFGKPAFADAAIKAADGETIVVKLHD